MSFLKVYLAGPIAGCTYEGATDWRKRASELLAPEISGFSPMRGKEYLKNAGTIGDKGYDQFPMSTSKAVLCRDHHDCTTSDVVIVYLKGAKKVSIGTVMEVAWAHHARVPIVLVMEKEGNVHEHLLLSEACNFRVETLEEACKVVKAILLPIE
jgi:nucleoside 2-deoxyribosyltransferase